MYLSYEGRDRDRDSKNKEKGSRKLSEGTFCLLSVPTTRINSLILTNSPKYILFIKPFIVTKNILGLLSPSYLSNEKKLSLSE